MILELDHNLSQSALHILLEDLQQRGLKGIMPHNQTPPLIVVVNAADDDKTQQMLSQLTYVKKVRRLHARHKLASRELQADDTVINIKGHCIGGNHLTIMAGPCAIESENQIMQIAKHVRAAGASVLRGGAFKPRTSPYDFQGLGEEGLRFMRAAADANRMLCVSEAVDPHSLQLVSRYIDIVQIGSRNMQNFELLKEAGRCKQPILLKRGMAATYTEFLLAAEYIMSHGNPNVILCERGIRTFETRSRNCLDLAAVPILREMTHLPIIVDPSHATGIRHAVMPMSMAAIAAGAHGLIIEAHTHPDQAISDAKQTLSIAQFQQLTQGVMSIADAIKQPPSQQPRQTAGGLCG